MTMTLKDIREKYPEYGSKTDEELADAIHNKYYSSLPKEKVYEKLGIQKKSNEDNQQSSMSLQQAINPQSEEERGFKGIGKDILSGLSNFLTTGKEFVVTSPDEFSKSLKQAFTNPARAVGNVGAELGEIAKGSVNLSSDLLPYLAKKEVLPFQGSVKEQKNIGSMLTQALINSTVKNLANQVSTLMPHIGNTGIESALGLNKPKEGDKFIRQLTDIATFGKTASIPVKAAYKKVISPSKDTLFKRALEDKRLALKQEHAADLENVISKNEAEISRFAQEHNLSEAELKEFKNALKKDFSKTYGERIGEVDPTGQEVTANIKEHELKELEPATQIPEKEVPPIPERPDVEKAQRALVEDSEKARKQLMDDTLEVRKNPELAAGSEFKKAIVNVHKNASDLYKQGRQIFKDQKIKANNTEEIKDVTRQMKELEINDELAPGYGTDTKEYKAMQKQLHALENETFDATDLFDMQRTLEKASKDATKMRFSTGISDQARTRYKEIAERYSKNAEVIQKALESVGGQEVQAIFKEANKGWKTYHDAKKNSVGRAVMLRGKGQIPSDTLVKLANEETGNAFFNALLDNDPKLRKNVLAAYVGKKNPDKLILTDDTTKEYLKKLPEVDSKLNDYKIALRKVAEGKISGKEEIKAHDALSKAIEKTAQEQKVRADAIKKSDILKKEIQFHKDAIPELEKRRLDLEGKKQQLENVKGQNAEKVKALKKQHEKEIQDIDHEILMHKLGMEDKNHRLKKIANAILKMPGVSLVARKIGL